MAKPKKPSEVISWYRPDLAYERLHQIKVTVSYYAGAGDIVGWYNALEEEYRVVWSSIERVNIDTKKYEGELMDKEVMDRSWFEKQFRKVRMYLYDPRNERDNFAAEKRKARNLGIAQRFLHEIQMILNDYETEANMNITTSLRKDPNKAMASYGS